MIGSRLTHFEILHKIGEGGMGVVYEARDTILDRLVAIKILPRATIHDAESRARLLRDAKAAAMVKHPNVADVYAVEQTDDGTIFIVMELYEKESLADRLARGPLAVDNAVEITLEIAAALVAAHERGVVHRDVKPANILFCSDGRAILADFGLARMSGLSSVTRTDMITGTAAYMAPEQINGSVGDQRSDLWSLGVCLYEMLTGRHPFHGEHELHVQYNIVNCAPPEFEFPSGSDRQRLAAVLEGLLTKDPDRRMQSALDLIEELSRTKKEGLIPTRRPARTRRRLAVLATVASFAFAAWIYGALVKGWGGAGQAVSNDTTLVVLPFAVEDDSGGGADFVGRAFAEAVVIHLLEGGTAKVLPIPTAQEIPPGGTDARRKACRRQGASHAVYGHIDIGATVSRVAINFCDVGSNELLWARGGDVSNEDLTLAAARYAGEILQHLGLRQQAGYESIRDLAGSREMAVSPELARFKHAYYFESVAAISAASKDLVEAFPGEFDAHVLRMFGINGEYQILGARQDLLEEFSRSRVRIEELDPANPYGELLSCGIYIPRGKDIETLTKLLARKDLAPELRAAILVARCDSYTNLGKIDEALADIEQATLLSPLGAKGLAVHARTLLVADRGEEALAKARMATVLGASIPYNNSICGWCLMNLGRYSEAAGYLERACEANLDQASCALVALAYEAAGESENMRRALQFAETMSPTIYGMYNLACCYSLIGNVDKAFDCLHTSIDLGCVDEQVLNDPDLDLLRADSRWTAVETELRRKTGQ